MKVVTISDYDKCEHLWIQESGFYISVCVSFEEPNFYPPAGKIQVEVCPNCGALRLPTGVESWPGYPVPE